MRLFKNFNSINSLIIAEIEKEIYYFLDDSKCSWEDKELFYNSTADDWKETFVNECWDEEGNSLGMCIQISIRYSISYTKKNWAKFAQIFKEQMKKLKANQ